jgi:hypothetical protein
MRDEHYVADLDAAELWRPLCTPLAREPNPHYDEDAYAIDGPPFMPFLYRGDYGLTESKKGLLLERCGSEHRVRLGSATSFDLRPTMVAWVTGHDTVHVRNLLSGRDWIWSSRGNTDVSVALTDTHVFITATKRDRRRILVQRRPR